MNIQNSRILFVVKNRIDTYGISVGLINSSRFVSEALNKRGWESKVVRVVDANSIDREVTNYNPDLVIIEALFVTPEKIREILSITRHQKRQWTIRIHSKTSFLQQEGIALDWLN